MEVKNSRVAYLRRIAGVVLFLLGLGGVCFGAFDFFGMVDWGQKSFFDTDSMFVFVGAAPAFAGACLLSVGVGLLRRAPTTSAVVRGRGETWPWIAAVLLVGLFGACAAFCGAGSLLAFALGHHSQSPDALPPGEYARYGAEWLLAGIAAFVVLWHARPGRAG